MIIQHKVLYCPSCGADVSHNPPDSDCPHCGKEIPYDCSCYCDITAIPDCNICGKYKINNFYWLETTIRHYLPPVRRET